jgi:phage tail-like protein
MKTMRLVLIAGVALVVLVAAGAAYVVLDEDDTRRTAALTTRSYTAGIVGLEVDGVHAGFIKSVAGCDVAAPVVMVAEAEGTSDKQSGAPKYTPCTIRFGSGMRLAFYEWISQTLAGAASPKDVSIIVYDYNYKALSRLDLAGATIMSFVVPRLSAASTEPVVFEVTLAASSVRRASPSGTASTTGTKAKQLLAGNFRLTAPGLESDLKRASVVESWSFEVLPAPEGETRLPTSGLPKFNDLAVTINAPGGIEFDAWLGALLKGNPAEKAVSLALYDPATLQNLVELSFPGAGLVGADLLGSAESTDSVAKRSFSMYVEGAQLKVNTAVSGG